jgi:acyl-CoA thioesterase-1
VALTVLSFAAFRHLHLPSIVMKTLVGILLVVSCCGVSAAQSKPSRKKPADAMAPVTDDPKLPRVLLIGDSISIGYTPVVREMLHGEANVHRALENCGPTTRGVEKLDIWLGNEKWDVIHFNFGLHDLKYIVDEKLPKKDRVKFQQVPPDDYRKNMEQIVERLQATGAKLIYATTTPVPAGAANRKAKDGPRYNEIALEIMKAHDIPVNDLFTFATERQNEIQPRRNVHFTPKGSEVLATEVVRHIREALAANSPK